MQTNTASQRQLSVTALTGSISTAGASGTLQSLADRSHRRHSYPNQHTNDEIKLILNIRRRNPNAGIVVFWVKLRQRGYTRSISGLYRFLCKRGVMAVKLPNLKYTPKPYEQMQHPGQRVQMDVKFVSKACMAGRQEPTQCFQYTLYNKPLSKDCATLYSFMFRPFHIGYYIPMLPYCYQTSI